MAVFNRVDGVFIAKCSFEERLLFQKENWLYDERIRKWKTSDIDKARRLRHLAIGAAKEFFDNADAIVSAGLAASTAEDTDFVVPSPTGLQYLPFQKAGVEYAVARKRTLIADAPGLGKTVQFIGIHNYLKTKKVIVVCPASLKINWFREFSKWDIHGLSIGIAESKVINKKTEHIWPHTDVVIVNYDMLKQFSTQIRKHEWDLVCADEAHLLKTPTTIRSKYFFGQDDRKEPIEPIRYKRLVLLTGTPIMSQPSELWTFVRECDPTDLGSSWLKFVHKYCAAEDTPYGLDVSGASNLEELNQKLRLSFMVRRDKRSVLKELPEKTRELVVFPKDKLEAIVKKEKTIVDKALEAYEKLLGIQNENKFVYIDSLIEELGSVESEDWEDAINRLSPQNKLLFTELSLAREEVALAKAGLVTDHVKNLVACGEAVIVFAYHKSVIQELHKRLSAAGLRISVVTGETSLAKRQAAVDAFQNGELDGIIGNITAMGVGWTLTYGSTVVMAELDWVPAMMEQAEDRAWRHGQKNAVLAQYLIVDGSVEANMAYKIIAKMEVIRVAIDAKQLDKLQKV